MKVLQINAVYGKGSTGTIVKDIHELSLDNRIESFVAYSSASVREKEIINGYQIGNVFGKKAHAFLCRINGMQGYFSRWSTKKFLRHIDRIQPDVVHLHNLHSNYIHLNMLLKYLAKKHIKTIVTLHDCWFYTGGCFHYTAAGCDRWLKECGACPKKKCDTPAYLLDRSAKVLRDRKKYFSQIKDLTVVGVSEWITQESIKTVFEGRPAVTIYNGIDTAFFKPTRSDLRETYGLGEKFVILGLASKWLSKVNRETFETVVTALQEDEVLMLIGCTNAQINELPNHVIGLPFVTDRDELRKIYSMADVFVNCTREESLSLANIEPQACGTPVITYSNTGAKETVDGISGFAVETGCPEKIIEKIRDIRKTNITDRKACRAAVLEKFDRRHNYQKYIDLFSSNGR